MGTPASFLGSVLGVHLGQVHLEKSRDFSELLIVQPKPMPFVRHHDELGFDPGSFKGTEEPLAMLHWNNPVTLTMDDEKRRQ